MSHHVIRSNADLSAYIASGGSPEYLLFWGHQPMKNSAIGKTCFSQWFESAFIVDDIRYRTAEHYMMAEKARLFEDSSAWQRILDATKPAAVKAIGREIQGFDEPLWLAHRWSIVVAGNYQKFSQDQHLREFLLSTGEQILVEASPVDNIWGVGLAADDPAIAHPDTWKGLNLLGFALMEVRQRLREQQ
ncbi:NADAR family protein [Herbaspirillum autotrophicum]|uniref:NADAR family protein n=1 Tax=Herbaspirillum autotrophicum TaxID=180195 RepID=UPI00067D24ED|nr:NADAR family protein [Herbaspirillum autotrophicum]